MSMKEPMNLARFTHLAEAYGADLSRWPKAEREAAAELLAASETARSLLAEAAQLDSLLDNLPEHKPSPDLRAAILAQATRSRRRSPAERLLEAWRGFWAELGSPLPVGLVLAASLALGIVLGAGTFASTSQPGVDLVQFALAADVYTQE